MTDSKDGSEWTPGPWTLSITHNDGGGWRSYARQYQITAGDKMIAYYETNYAEYPESDAENDANARRIVHCVNVHDDLVRALDGLIEKYEAIVADDMEARSMNDGALVRARAALRTAKESRDA